MQVFVISLQTKHVQDVLVIFWPGQEAPLPACSAPRRSSCRQLRLPPFPFWSTRHMHRTPFVPIPAPTCLVQTGRVQLQSGLDV